MADYRFNREARTPYSEVYTIDDGEHALGRVDVHYTGSAAHATLVVHAALSDEQVQDLLEAIDDQIVTSADPYREDLVVTVWRGEEMGVFADDDGSEEDGDGDADGDSGEESE
ncbi:MAG: hypothetical protein OXH97_01720 [Chloroflexota bacterium]|nr:hypothetical protein [Chloroflexota bacterium]